MTEIDKIKIVGVVKFNKGEAFVLNHMPELEYTRYGSTIIGTDETFHVCYVLQYTKYSKAFGGREFDLTMKDGEVVHCKGQWWSSISNIFLELYPGTVPVTYGTIEELKKCYVFIGFRATRSKIETLRAAYKGLVYGYDEYRKMLNERKKIMSKMVEVDEKLLGNYKKLANIMKEYWESDNNAICASSLVSEIRDVLNVIDSCSPDILDDLYSVYEEWDSNESSGDKHRDLRLLMKMISIKSARIQNEKNMSAEEYVMYVQKIRV